MAETWKKCTVQVQSALIWASNAGFTVPQLLCRSCLRVFSPAQPQGTCGSDYVLACGGESPSTLDCRHRLWVFGIRWVYHGLPLLHAFTIFYHISLLKGWTVPLGRRVRRTRSERNTLQVLRPIFSYLSDPRSSVRRQAELSAVAILQKAQEEKHWRGCLIRRWTCASMPPIFESMIRHHLTPEFFFQSWGEQPVQFSYAHGVILIFTKPSDGPCALEDSQTIEFAVQHLTQMLQTASRSDKKASFVRTSCCLKSAEGHPVTSASIILNGSFFYIYWLFNYYFTRKWWI